MAYTESFLTRAITDAREWMDEPSANAKYTDARIIHHLEQAYIQVLNEVNRNSKTQVVAKTNVTVTANTTKYVLPHVVGSVYAVYDATSTSGEPIFYAGRSRYNPFGRGLWIEGNVLNIQTVDSLGVGTTLTVEWIPVGVARLHNGTCTVDSDGDAITFGATPNAGTLDTHNNAYAGSVFRLLEVDGTTVTGSYLQERTITAYDETTRVATLSTALDPIPTTDDGSIFYEIAPAVHKGMDMIVPLYAAYRIMAVEGNKRRASGLLEIYKQDKRNLRLVAHYTDIQEANLVRVDQFNSRRYRRI